MTSRHPSGRVKRETPLPADNCFYKILLKNGTSKFMVVISIVRLMLYVPVNTFSVMSYPEHNLAQLVEGFPGW